MVDDATSGQPSAIMSVPTATAGSNTSLIRRTPLPDIRPICALADAAEAVSRVVNNGGIAPTNDNDKAAILASLSSASLLPNRGGNVVSPTSQLQLENTTSSFDSNSNTKRYTYKKKLCAIPTCTNGSVKGGVCVSHGARRHMNICHFKGCKKVIKVGDFCYTHVRRCDAPGCLRFVVQGVRTNYFLLFLLRAVTPTDPNLKIYLHYLVRQLSFEYFPTGKVFNS